MQHPQENFPKKETSSLKPFVIAFVLILVVIGIYIVKKNYINKKNPTTIEKAEKQSERIEKIDIKLASSEKTNKAINNNDYQLIDIRPVTLFDFSHIESSINLPLPTNDYSNIIDKDKKIIVIDEQETNKGKLFTEKLSKDGYEVFYLNKGIQNYSQQDYSVISVGDINSDHDKAKVRFVSAKEVQERLKNLEKFSFLDVRTKNDFEQYHIEESTNIPLEQLEKNKKSIPTGKIIVVDKDPIRSFQAAVRLYDMHILGVSCLSEELDELEKQNPPEEESSQKN
jgi:rhodanese-related sulfurtransferase